MKWTSVASVIGGTVLAFSPVAARSAQDAGAVAEPAHITEWNAKNRFEDCYAEPNEANCRATIDLGFRLAQTAMANGRLQEAVHLLKASHETAMLLADQISMDSPDNATARSILEAEFLRLVDFIGQAREVSLAYAAPQLAGQLAYYLLSEGQTERAHEVIAQLRRWRGATLKEEDLRNPQYREESCILAQGHYLAEGIISSSLSNFATDPEEGRRQSEEAAREEAMIGGLLQTHCQGG